MTSLKKFFTFGLLFFALIKCNALLSYEFSASIAASAGYEYDKQAWKVGFATLVFDFEAPTHYVAFPFELQFSLDRLSLRGYGRGGVMIDSEASDLFASNATGQLSKVHGPLNGYQWLGGGEAAFEVFSCLDDEIALSVAAGWCYEYTKYPVPNRYHIDKGVTIPSFTFAPGGAYIPIFFGPLMGLDGSYRGFRNFEVSIGYRIGLWDFHSDSTLNGGVITSPDTITPNQAAYIYKARIKSILVQQAALKLTYCLSNHFRLVGSIEGQIMDSPHGKVTVSINDEPPFANAVCQATSRYVCATLGMAYIF